jgi:hypothetical protein
MTRHGQTPQLTELDLLLLRERGWSFCETQEKIAASLDPRAPGAFRRAVATALHELASWLEPTDAAQSRNA